MHQLLDRGDSGNGQVQLSGSEPTTELVIAAKRGSPPAAHLLMQRCLPPLRRWAHGRLPPHARGQLDTCDLVQDVAMHTLRRLPSFEIRHAFGLQGYLRLAVMNRIRDELRRRARRPPTIAIHDGLRSRERGPLSRAIEQEDYRRLRGALRRLSPRDRRLIVARADRGWDYQTIADRLGMPSAAAATMAVSRAVRRLRVLLGADTAVRP